MSEVAQFWQVAEKCERLADQLTDQKAAKSLRDLATEYRRKAQDADPAPLSNAPTHRLINEAVSAVGPFPISPAGKDKMKNEKNDQEELIRQRAYLLWELEGRPEGRAEEYWHRARELVESEAQSAYPPSDT